MGIILTILGVIFLIDGILRMPSATGVLNIAIAIVCLMDY